MTRLTRGEMFDQQEVLDTLRNGSWDMVPDSMSGPRRSALDLGTVTIHPGLDTRKADGTQYEPVDVRVVVSRFLQTGKATHGRVIDGWQYEMFVVDVGADAFPAPEAVAMFFGRAGQENRFAQEDREAGLDRIFSYHLPGQEFATIIGLWVWNLRVVRGFELALPPALRPAQEPYVAQVDQRSPLTEEGAAATIPSGDGMAPEPAQSGHGSKDTQGAQPEPICRVADPEPLPVGPRAPGFVDEQAVPPLSSASDDTSSPCVAPVLDPPEDELLMQLSHIDWNHALRNHPGWSWNPSTGHLQCVDGRELVLTTVRKDPAAPGFTRIIFCRPVRGCEACPTRLASFSSTRPRASRHMEVSVPTPIASLLRELLKTQRIARRHARQTSQTVRRALPAPRPRPFFPIAPLPPSFPLLAVLPALFLPAVARQLLRAAASTLTVAIAVMAPPPTPPRPVLIARSIAEKQHRRKTWRQHSERYALEPGTRVNIELAAGDALRSLLQPRQEVPMK